MKNSDCFFYLQQRNRFICLWQMNIVTEARKRRNIFLKIFDLKISDTASIQP